MFMDEEEYLKMIISAKKFVLQVTLLFKLDQFHPFLFLF